MKCPNDNISLLMTDRQGIEIDYCPDCRGIWLDKGELDKLIERADTSHSPKKAHKTINRNKSMDYEEDDQNYSRSRNREGGRGGFLGDLFDFGD